VAELKGRPRGPALFFKADVEEGTGASPSMQSAQVRHLGEGSFASVEECVLAGQHVAVKRLRPELFRDLDEIKGFVAEGITLAELEHPCGSRVTPS